MPFPRVSADLQANTAAVVAEQRISADSHMAEPPDLWEKRLPPELRDRAPHFPKVKPLESRAHLRAGGWDPHERQRDQAYDGISAEVLFLRRYLAACQRSVIKTASSGTRVRQSTVWSSGSSSNCSG